MRAWAAVWFAVVQDVTDLVDRLIHQLGSLQQLVIRILAPERMDTSAAAALLLP